MRIIITGGTDGIGKQTAIQLAEQGHKLVVIGRPGKKAKQVETELQQRFGADRIQLLSADLGLMNEVEKLAAHINQHYPDTQVLINNAAVIRQERQLTAEGLEECFAVNHLAPFLLTTRLLDNLQANTPARIVNVSSMVHQGAILDFDDLQSAKHYDAYTAYAQTKLANVLFTRSLAHMFERDRLTANCLHPGVISTKLLHQLFMGGDDPTQGAKTSVFLASSPEALAYSGHYFIDSEPRSTPHLSGSMESANKLWKASERLLADILTD